MKKILTLIILFFTLFIVTGCTKENTEPKEEVTPSKISIELKEGTSTSSKATFIVTNTTKLDYNYGPEFALEKYSNDLWVALPLQDEISYTTEVFTVKAKSTIVPVRIIGNYRLFSKMILRIGEPIDAPGYNKDELTEKFCLDSVLRRKAGKLSGGWQRRISIAMALIGEPEFLFLDEPTLGLDVIARHELWDIIRSLKGSVTVILTTHYMQEAENLSDRIGVMKNGSLLAVGTADELINLAGAADFESAFVRIVKEGEV